MKSVSYANHRDTITLAFNHTTDHTQTWNLASTDWNNKLLFLIPTINHPYRGYNL